MIKTQDVLESVGSSYRTQIMEAISRWWDELMSHNLLCKSPRNDRKINNQPVNTFTCK